MGFIPHPSSVKAGKIAARVLKEACSLIRPGTKVISICTSAERRILELGGKPAFPCNVSIDHIAAHYTSPKSDRTTIPEFGVVKIDVGVHVNGHIADTARTIAIDGSLQGLVDTADDALNEAISMMKPGVHLGNIGKTIENVIKAYGMKPIKELTGHNLEPFKLHAGKRVPNYKTRDPTPLEAGEYYAIEPFATSGSSVGNAKNAYIFANLTGNVELESPITEKLRSYLRKKYGPFPFASRWVRVSRRTIDLEDEFRNLLRAKAIKGFPVLVEKKGRPVSQSEHTVFITEDKAQILTKPD